MITLLGTEVLPTRTTCACGARLADHRMSGSAC